MITVLMNVFNEADLIELCLKQFRGMDFIKKIIIVEGSTPDFYYWADEKGASTDGTVEIIKRMQQEDNRIKLIQGKWKNKKQQRNEYLKYVETDYCLVVDADEFYRQKDLIKLHELSQELKPIAILYPQIPFYYDIFHYSINMYDNHLRFFRYNPDLFYEVHSDINDSQRRLIREDPIYRSSRYMTANHLNKKYTREGIKSKYKLLDVKLNWFHLGHARDPLRMLIKLSYYAHRTNKYSKNKKSLFQCYQQVFEKENWFDKRIFCGKNPDPLTIKEYKGDYPEILKNSYLFNRRVIK